MTQFMPAYGPINPLAALREVPSFAVSSADIQDGEPLPAAQFKKEAGGSDLSPELSWTGFPAETKSFAITCFDPDAPTGSGFWHWAVANIPGTVTSLSAGAGDPDAGLLPEGAVTVFNELRERAYTGAAPPEGTGVHHYWFVVHALSVPQLEIPEQATPAVMGFLMRDAVIARAVLVATGEYGGAA